MRDEFHCSSTHAWSGAVWCHLDHHPLQCIDGVCTHSWNHEAWVGLVVRVHGRGLLVPVCAGALDGKHGGRGPFLEGPSGEVLIPRTEMDKK